MNIYTMLILLCLFLGEFVASKDTKTLERPVQHPRVPSLECDVPCPSGTGFLYCTKWKRQKTNGDFGNAAMDELCIPPDSRVPDEAQCGACSRRTHKNKTRDYNVHSVKGKKGHKGKRQKYGKHTMPPTAEDIHDQTRKRGKSPKNHHKKNKNRDYNKQSANGKKGRKGKRQKVEKQQKQSTAESSKPHGVYSSNTSSTKKNTKTKAPISQNNQSETNTMKHPGKTGKKRSL